MIHDTCGMNLKLHENNMLVNVSIVCSRITEYCLLKDYEYVDIRFHLYVVEYFLASSKICTYQLYSLIYNVND